jgi:hypothetical protein
VKAIGDRDTFKRVPIWIRRRVNVHGVGLCRALGACLQRRRRKDKQRAAAIAQAKIYADRAEARA